MLKNQMNVEENDQETSINGDEIPVNISIELESGTPAGPASGGNTMPPRKSKKALSSLNHQSVPILPSAKKMSANKAY